MKIYNIFHLNLLQKAAKNPLPGQTKNLAPPIIIDNKEKWEVDDILDAKKKGKSKKLQFQVK